MKDLYAYYLADGYAAHVRLMIIGRPIAKTFARCQSGSTAILFAFMSAVILLLIGGTIDFLRLSSFKSKMQSLADATAVLSARSISVAQSDEASVKVLAETYIKSYADKSIADVAASISVNMAVRRVALTLTYAPETYFQTPFVNSVLNVTATAQVVGQLPLCVLTLNEDDNNTIEMNKNSLLTGVDCAVYANSKASRAISVAGGGQLSAGLVCSAGGGSGNMLPALTRDCPILPDPLAGRPAPSSSMCDETGVTYGVATGSSSTTSKGIGKLIKSDTSGERSGKDKDRSNPTPVGQARQSIVLKPGVYCGGLAIGSGFDVELEPGVYVIKDGPLFIDGDARLTGSHVGFYFTGEGSSFYFGSYTSIHLTAPADGELAGLLFYQDPANEQGQLFGILSDDARVLTGTIYLPNGELVVDSDEAVADQSAYTAIVARNLTLYTGPNLVLNSDYDATDVPAAVGIDYNKTVRLVN